MAPPSRERRRWRRGADPETAETASDVGPETEPPAPADEPEPPSVGDDGDDEGTDDTASFSLRNAPPLLLLRSAHPRQAVVTALAMAVAAALQGRASRELLLILGTVLVGQAILGWFNDLVDRRRDAKHEVAGKPVADGRLDPGTVWFALAVAVFAVVPLSVANGLYAATAYLASLAIGLVGQWVWIRKGFFSWVPWALAFALYPAFLSYGGWGGQYRGEPPEIVMTVLAGLLGIGVHFFRALWGLVPDHAEGWTYLPLKLGMRVGASRLLWISTVYMVLVLVAIAFAGTYGGLTQGST